MLRVAVCLTATLVEQGQARGEIAERGDTRQPGRKSESRTFEKIGVDKRRLAEGRKLRDSGAGEWLKTNLDGGRKAFDSLLKQASRAQREDKLKAAREARERATRPGCRRTLDPWR